MRIKGASIAKIEQSIKNKCEAELKMLKAALEEYEKALRKARRNAELPELDLNLNCTFTPVPA